MRAIETLRQRLRRRRIALIEVDGELLDEDLEPLLGDQLIEAWAGPGKGTQRIPGKSFQPYIATPPFAEYTSGHSAFSAAGAEVLTRYAETDVFVLPSDYEPFGLVVLEAGDESVLEHVRFRALRAVNEGGWVLTGAVTFYDSPVEVLADRWEAFVDETIL